MPYRRLPNTDAARIRALKAALKKGQYLEIDTIAYPFALKQKIEFFLWQEIYFMNMDSIKQLPA